MALTIDTLNALVKEKSIIKGFVNQIYQYNPLMDFLKKGKSLVDVKGGKRIMVGLEYGTVSGTTWSGVGEIPTPQNRPEIATEAWFDWAFYNMPVKITYKEWMLVERGAYTLEDFAKKILDRMAKGAANDFEKYFFMNYSTAANRPVFGLHQLISNTDATDGSNTVKVGDISVNDESWWVSHVFTYDATAGLIKNMFKVLDTLTYKWGKPDLILTSQDIYEAYAFTSYDKGSFQIRDEFATKLGFQVGASFDGIPIIFSTDPAVAGKMYFINSDYIKFVVHPEADFKLSEFKQISTTNYDYVAMIDTIYSLVVSNRNAHAVLTGITL